VNSQLLDLASYDFEPLSASKGEEMSYHVIFHTKDSEVQFCTSSLESVTTKGNNILVS